MTTEDKRTKTLTTIFAEEICECDMSDESFAECLADSLIDGMDELDIANDEYENLVKCLTDYVAELRLDAEELVADWNENARELADAARSAIYG